jgi:hypothetical protein
MCCRCIQLLLLLCLAMFVDECVRLCRRVMYYLKHSLRLALWVQCWTRVCFFWHLLVFMAEDSFSFYACVTCGVVTLLAAKVLCLLAPVMFPLQQLRVFLLRYAAPRQPY